MLVWSVDNLVVALNCILVFASSDYPLCRKVDDLQFLLEEQGVISGDTLEIATETSAQKLSNLQQQLDEEKEISKKLQQQLEVCVFAHLNSVSKTDGYLCELP